jgi:hypothetical protein
MTKRGELKEKQFRIDSNTGETVEFEGEAIGVFVKPKLFRVKLKVETIVHRFIVHEDPVEAGRQAAAAAGLGVFGEGALSAVTPVEVKDVTKSGMFNVLIEEGENS